jgi:hypothetical protein
MVTTNVYSHDRQHLLVPQGARVLGEVKRAETFGQERLAVTFHRFVCRRVLQALDGLLILQDLRFRLHLLIRIHRRH